MGPGQLSQPPAFAAHLWTVEVGTPGPAAQSGCADSMREERQNPGWGLASFVGRGAHCGQPDPWVAHPCAHEAQRPQHLFVPSSVFNYKADKQLW